jgi:uncharacterized membrane protein
MVSFRLIGLGLIFLALCKLCFVIMNIKELEHRFLAFMGVEIALILISFIY